MICLMFSAFERLNLHCTHACLYITKCRFCIDIIYIYIHIIEKRELLEIVQHLQRTGTLYHTPRTLKPAHLSKQAFETSGCGGQSCSRCSIYNRNKQTSLVPDTRQESNKLLVNRHVWFAFHSAHPMRVSHWEIYWPFLNIYVEWLENCVEENAPAMISNKLLGQFEPF